MSRMRLEAEDIPNADIFAVLLEHFPDIIHSVGDDGRIVFTNRAAERLLGYTRDELIGMPVRDIYADEILADMDSGFQDLKERGEKQVESLLKAKDGTRIPVEIRSFSIYDDAGNFVRTFSILRDIRQIKELQNGLIHAGRLAAIGELATGILHDINNPLTVVMLANDLQNRMLADPALGPAPVVDKLRGQSRDIHRAAQAIRKLCEHLRNFSRRMGEEVEPVDIAQCLGDAIFIAGSKITKSGVHVDNLVPAGCITDGSPNQLEQVFVNLIGNACDAMEERPTRLLILNAAAETRDGIDYWAVTVEDTGCGIPADHREDVFGSFFTTKEKGKGTGLGLSISRGIVRDHHGEIEITSSTDTGTVFTVLLPRVATPA